MVCGPEDVRRAPKTIVEAQFSIPYNVASAWVDGAVRMGHFTDAGLRREDILAVASKVVPYVDEEIDRDWRRFVTPAKVSIEFTDGEVLESQEPEDFALKAIDCISYAAVPLQDNLAETLRSVVSKLESLDSALRGPSAP